MPVLQKTGWRAAYFSSWSALRKNGFEHREVRAGWAEESV